MMAREGFDGSVTMRFVARTWATEETGTSARAIRFGATTRTPGVVYDPGYNPHHRREKETQVYSMKTTSSFVRLSESYPASASELVDYVARTVGADCASTPHRLVAQRPRVPRPGRRDLRVALVVSSIRQVVRGLARR